MDEVTVLETVTSQLSRGVPFPAESGRWGNQHVLQPFIPQPELDVFQTALDLPRHEAVNIANAASAIAS